jgi:transposase-like protein
LPRRRVLSSSRKNLINWADGLYVKAGLEDTKAALLVMIGVLTNGQKVVLAVESRQRESKNY